MLKRGFVRGIGGIVESALVREHVESNTLHVGSQVQFRLGFDYEPYTVIEAGEIGQVVSHNPVTGEVEVEMVHRHAGLSTWSNCILLVPFDTDAILSGIVCHDGNVYQAATVVRKTLAAI